MRLRAFEPAEPVCFVSPHLDDAVLSCASAIARRSAVTVVTMFASVPPVAASPWDRETTGEAWGKAALRIRRAEDEAALACLGAVPHWLPFADALYRPRPSVEQLRSALAEAVEASGAASVVGPLGIRHEDHRLAAAVCLDLARDVAAQWYVYEDQPYAAQWPELVRPRIDEVEPVEPLEPVPAHGTRKRDAVDCYRSQVRVLQKYVPAFQRALAEPERYWRLTATAAA